MLFHGWRVRPQQEWALGYLEVGHVAVRPGVVARGGRLASLDLQIVGGLLGVRFWRAIEQIRLARPGESTDWRSLYHVHLIHVFDF